MKLFCAILVLIVGFSACGKIENFTNLTAQKIETEKTEAEQPDVPPILEIVQDAKGMSAVTGKTLFFNLYDNGVIEFEYADEAKKIAGKSNKAEEINTLKRAKISKDELQKFHDLLKTPEFQNAKDDYKRKCCCTDAFLNYKINFQDSNRQKNIDLNGFCNFRELINSQKGKISDLPNVLSDLMLLVQNTREKYILEKSSNQPQ